MHNLENFELRDFTKRNLVSFKNLILNTKQQINSSISVQELKNIINIFIDNISYRQCLVDSSSSEKQAEFRYANVIEVTKWIVNQLEDESYNGLESLAALLNKMLLIDILDRNNEDKNDNQVQIITIHASKGLEFKKVYIMGMEEGILPHQQSIEDDSIEDERRLTYVAITRARENLTITMTKHSKKFGGKQVSIPSRFIDELPETDLYWVGTEKECAESRKENSKQNISALKDMFG